jgi:hypothetical protein
MKANKFIIFIILTMLAGSCITKKGANMEDKFRGMWKLDKFEAYDSVSRKWADDITRIGYSGYILYDGLGHMSVHLMPKAYNDFDSDKNTDSLSLEELQHLTKIYKSNYVYFANYKIENGTVFHSKLSATNPKDRGSIAIRDFEFKGDTLILKPKEKINGLRLRLEWIRVSN